MLLRALSLVLVTTLAACENNPERSSAAQAEGAQRTEAGGAAAPAPKAGYRRYGEPLPAVQAVSLTKVLEDPASYKDKTVLVEGDVRRACSRKGCWMELADSPDKANPGCRVTFKDYGFFVPTDSQGAHARVHGVVEVTTVKASHVEHMEEEGATFAKKNPDGTAEEVRLVATGVELKK